MVLVVLDHNELDSNFMIENAIRNTLGQGHLSAGVRSEDITKVYTLPDAADAKTGTLEEKCDAIVKKLDDLNLETFFMKNENETVAVFQPDDPRRPSGDTK